MKADDNGITTLVDFSNLNQLDTLSLKDNMLTSLAALDGITRVRYLYIDNNQLSNIDPLFTMSGLSVVSILDNPNVSCSDLDRLDQNVILYRSACK